MITDHLAGDTESTPLKTGLYQVLFKSKICITIGAERSTFEFDGSTMTSPLSIFLLLVTLPALRVSVGSRGLLLTSFRKGCLVGCLNS
jgi:hypothetical protein